MEKALKNILNHFRGRYALLISADRNEIFAETAFLHHCWVSGYLDVSAPQGATFSADAWPFRAHQFDVVMLENALTGQDNPMSVIQNVALALNDGGIMVVYHHAEQRLTSASVLHSIALGCGMEKLHEIFATNIAQKGMMKKWMSWLIPSIYNPYYLAIYQKPRGLEPLVDRRNAKEELKKACHSSNINTHRRNKL